MKELNKKLTIFQSSNKTSSTNVKKNYFNIILEGWVNRYKNNYSNIEDLEDLIKIIDNMDPDLIILFGDNLHANTIVSFLKKIMSKKYKPFIYQLSIKHDFVQTKSIVIKFVKMINV